MYLDRFIASHSNFIDELLKIARSNRINNKTTKYGSDNLYDFYYNNCTKREKDNKMID